MKYRLFKRKKSNQFFFQIQTDGGDAVLESQGYDQKDARNNGLRSVVTNGGDAGKYEKKTEGGKHYFILKAGNGQEIARSVMFDNGGDADKSMALCVKEVPKLAPAGDGAKTATATAGGTGGGTTTTTTTTEAGKTVTEGSNLVAANRTANVNIDAPPPPKEKKPKKKRKKKPAGEKKPKKEKVYLSNGEYYFNDITYQVFRSGNDKHYFTFKNKAEKTIFLNADVRGFVTQDEAEEMVKEVFKYAPFEGNYEGKATTNGKYYFYLKNAEGKNLAKSFFYGTTDGMQAAIGELLGNEEAIAAARASAGGGAAAATTATKTTTTVTAKAGVDEYLDCSAYSGAAGWHTFTEGGEFYFSYNNEDGKSLLRSEGYTSEKARDNGIESVKKNAPLNERWKVLSEEGKWFHSLKAGNHQEIARSCPLDSEPEAMNWSSYSAKKVAAKTVAPAAAAVTAVAAKKGGQQDEYLDCAAYKGGSGFHKFEKNGEYYFGYNDDKGNTILRSEGYTSESGRDNGIESVKKNATEEKRWSTVEEGGKYYRVLKAGNHQEIGRSCPADSASGPAWSWMWSNFSVASAVPKQSIPAPEKIVFTPEPAANVDEYLECSAYAGGKGFHKFEKNGEYYFGYNDDNGNTILRSEGYTTEKARDNGIESVKKNATDESKWSTVEEGGKYFRILKAGNHQEIGRSCPADSASGPAWSWMWSSFAVAGAVAPKSIPAAEKIEFAAPPPPEPVVVKVKSEEEKEDDYLPCKEYEGHNVNDKINNIAFFKHENGQFYFAVYDSKGGVRLRSEGFQDTKTRDEELSGVVKNLKNEDMYKTIKKGKYSMRILYDKTGREVGRSCLIKVEEKVASPVVPAAAAAAVVAAAPKVIKKKTTEEKEDDYLACKEYEGKTVTDKANNIALFKHTNGQFYFVAYHKDGSVRYRSEGFETTEKRKEELDGVIAYMGNKDMMKTIKKGKYTMHILYDAEGREVGRSCLIKEQEKKVVKAAPVVAAAAAAVVATQPKAKKEVDKEDDYLACKEYEGKKINDKTNNIALFKHKNGQFYFAVYNADKTVRLRSEGFKNGKERDVELAGVIKHMGDKSMYKTIKKGKYHMDILYDKTGREVGRSCLETEKPVVIKPTKKKVVPVATATKAAAATTAAAAATTATTATAAKSGCAWWPWLLLLLIPLLLCFFKPEWCGCGDKAAVTNTPPPVEKVVPPPVEEVTPPPPAEVTCNCSGNSSNRIFNVPTSGTPKSLSRLGTNPEFGNSHSLDGAGFYNKLKRAYANSSRDKVFLDNLFKGMGYDGFGDATAEMFSETRIPRGTVGNIGASKAHRTVHAKLNVTSDRDLMAFRIDAKNGCDMHFMKTCGNHFFYCPN